MTFAVRTGERAPMVEILGLRVSFAPTIILLSNVIARPRFARDNTGRMAASEIIGPPFGSHGYSLDMNSGPPIALIPRHSWNW